MHTKDLFIDDGGDGKAVEAVREEAPKLDREPPLAYNVLSKPDAIHYHDTFIVKSIDSVDTGTFMVAAEDEKVLWVLDLVGEQEGDGLEGLPATVNIVAEEEVVGVWGEAAIFKQPQQIIVLSMNIT